MALLLRGRGIDVAGEAGDVETLLALVASHAPDVAVVDIRMPPSFTDEGITATATIRRQHPGTGVLVLSQYLETEFAARVLSEGATGVGYLLKERVTDAAELVDGIRRVANGESVLDPELVRRLLDRRRTRDPLESITAKEREVLSLIAQGRSNQAIGDELSMSEKTVESHIRNLLMKLDITESPDSNRRVLAVLTYLRQT